MAKYVILGGSGFGMIAASIIRRNGEDMLLGFLNDIVPVGSQIGKFDKIPVIGKTEHIEKYLEESDIKFFIGYVGMQNEESVYEKIQKFNIPTERYGNIIDKSAIIPEGYSKIGKGVMFAPLSQISPDVEISNNCILAGNSFVGHDAFLDHFAHIATNAVVGANVHIGKGVHVGSNAVIREKIHIGDFSLIGSGAVVVKDVPENSIVVGNPAKVLRIK